MRRRKPPLSVRRSQSGGCRRRTPKQYPSAIQPETEIGHYRILRRLGAGGMGEVFLADDLQLHRKVALKLLPSSAAHDESASRRLIREAHAAASLDHPNICSIYEIGQHANLDFIVMQYVEGETLASRLARQPMETSEAVGNAIQIADALAEAHARGIVHRDIKPQNFMVTTRGQIKVMDFGLAKVVREAESGADTQSQLTAPGLPVGTAAYMSPEQIRGGPIDARSDLFALGIVLYEMVSGVRPFESATVPDTFSAILTREPAPLTRASPELARIVIKALRKEAAERYQTANEMLSDLRRIAGESTSKRRVPRRLLIAVAGAVLVLAIITARWAVMRPSVEIRSLAVLPLQNLSADPAEEYFADGMTEALTAELAKISSLRVISRTSAMQYKSARKPLPEIARELNVDAIVEGSVLHAGGKVRITAQLIHAPTDRHLWADSFDRDARDVFRLQSDVAQSIARRINLALIPPKAKARPVDPRVNEAHLKGLYYLNQAINQPSPPAKRALHDKSFVELQRAIEIDPTFSPAWATLARSYHWLASSGFPEFYPKAKEAAIKAIELDDTNAEAHGALAFTIQNLDWDWAGAEREYKRAIELNPSLGNTGHHGYALLLSAWGRHDEAIAEILLAEQLDPLTIPLKASIAQIYRHARRYGEAEEKYRNVMELSPNLRFLHAGLGHTYLEQGRHDEAISALRRALELSGNDPRSEAGLARAYALKGERGRATEIVNRLEKLATPPPGLDLVLAIAHAALGNRDRAIALLEKGYRAHSGSLIQIKVAPEFDPLRSDPRFQDIIKRMNFPD